MSHTGEQSAADRRRGVEDPDGEWGEQARAINWFRRPRTALDGVLNTCYNALDRHVIAGLAEHTALVHHSAITGEQRSYSYAELTDQVARIGGALTVMGVGKGDRVVIHLPMVAEAAMAMLACARIGAVHAVVSGGCTVSELAVQIDDARPKVVLTASCVLQGSRVIAGKPLVDEALEKASHTVDHVLVLQRPQLTAELVEPRDVDWRMMTRPGAFEPASCVDVAATDPLYLLHTSGTGKPEGIVRDNGPHAMALVHAMQVQEVGPDDVMFTASEVSSQEGHSHLVYGPLLVGATTVMYEGDPVGATDTGAIWKAVADHGVTCMITAAETIEAVRKVDAEGELIKAHDTSMLRQLFLVGEPDPDTTQWISERLSVEAVTPLPRGGDSDG
ncbi:AMP-binding protein [Propionibacteriaceae bacterium Y1700]|uniref:AMP-binding protein n=1 Tax=Microlunatus sp. Y1700 TaxID=3418487 RepID=UPI003DA773B0